MSISIKSKNINHTVNNPRFSRVGTLRKVLHKITLGRFTPGITIESRRLLKASSPGDKITVENDGFYRDGEKIAGNEYISERIIKNDLPIKFQRTEDDAPRIIAKYCRSTYKESTPSQTLRQTALYALLFALPDLALKTVVNLTISPTNNLIRCGGWFKPGEAIEWQFVPKDTLFQRLLGFSKGACEEYIPNGFSVDDFATILEVHNKSPFSFDRTSSFLENCHHYNNLGLLGLILFGISLPSLIRLLLDHPKKNISKKILQIT